VFECAVAVPVVPQRVHFLFNRSAANFSGKYTL